MTSRYLRSQIDAGIRSMMSLLVRFRPLTAPEPEQEISVQSHGDDVELFQWSRADGLPNCRRRFSRVASSAAVEFCEFTWKDRRAREMVRKMSGNS